MIRTEIITHGKRGNTRMRTEQIIGAAGAAGADLGALNIGRFFPALVEKLYNAKR